MGSKPSKTTTTTTSKKPVPPASDAIASTVALGAGCYWGTEKYVTKDFQKRFPNSMKSATVGFMSPHDVPPVAQPTYQQVCAGTSGHVEVLLVELNHPAAHFEELVRFFFSFHDPTTKNRQGNDIGLQYSSWIFCADAEQAQIVHRVRDELQELITSRKITAYAQRHVTTTVTPLQEFVPAHEEHQRYLEKHPRGYCNHRIRFAKWPE